MATKILSNIQRLIRINSRLPKCGAWSRNVSETSKLKPNNLNKVTVTFITKDGERLTVKGKEGDNLLDIVIDNNLDLDGYGMCGGTVSCSTCHVILPEDVYKKTLPGELNEEEFDILDSAADRTNTSRLGCQVCVTKDLDGLEVQLPSTMQDLRS